MTSHTTHAGSTDGVASHPCRVDQVSAYHKLTWRLMLFPMLCYMMVCLDRMNAGCARLQILNHLKLSESVYGLDAGVFFLGNFLFAAPGDMILHRTGTRQDRPRRPGC